MQHLEPRKRSSTPAVVPGAAPALAKAGVGGYNVYLHEIRSKIQASSLHLAFFVLDHLLQASFILGGK